MIDLRELTPNNVRKFLRYSFDAASFTPRLDHPPISEAAQRAAARIRGAGCPPAILLHGVMPRSGTVYVAELLRLHPDVYAFPNHIWEFPFLQHAAELAQLQRHFLQAYEQNAGKIGELDFLPLFGAAMIAYLRESTPEGKRLLLKVPSVQHLTYFFHVFPDETLLLLTRDGRDVVQSTLRTWPVLRFPMVCMRWRCAATMALAFDRAFGHRREGYTRARFEDAVRDPPSFARGMCRRLGLDEDRFPYDQLALLPVRGSSALRSRQGVSWDAQPRPSGFKPTERWQEWSPLHKWMFKRIAGRQLLELGYCEDLNW
jgi:protein-tyrosine sulfotransferase